jgi:hypothetical protein
MAKNKISEWSATAANNTDIGGIDIAEGCAPSGINNAIRELMAQVKDQQTGTDADNFVVGGNLSVTGTTTATGAMSVTGAITATGGVTGNVTGNVIGNTTGNVTGNLISVTNTVTSGSFIVGNTYTILTVGTTDFTLIGASANTVGVRFTATGVGTGTGTATTFTGRAVGLFDTLAVSNGGTGSTSITANSLLLGNGTSALSGNLVAPSTIGNVLMSSGTTWTSATKITSNSLILSGVTSAAVTSIPSWVKRITINFVGAGTNGTSNILIQIGDSGGYEITGYNSVATYSTTNVTATTGFIVYGSTATDSRMGTITLTKSSTVAATNTWVASGNVSSTLTTTSASHCGYKSLSSTLDRVQVTTVSGTDLLDSGTCNITYE